MEEGIFDDEISLYILPNKDDYLDDPIKYALQLDNSYKLGYFTYKYNIKNAIILLLSKTVGGD
jgi:hypothetical protein